jgi:O-antigen ligase
MFFEKSLIKEKIKEIFFILFIPVLITFFISSINTTQADSGLRIAQEIKKDIKTINQPFDSNIFTGFKVRIETWKEITNNSSKPGIGYGSQADRYLAKNLPSHTQLAANSFIYAYACAGLLGVAAIIIIYFNIIKLIIKRILATNLKNKINNVQIFYIVVLSFLIIRSIVENSFAVWGIDFILMINCYLGLKSSSIKLNNKKYLFK